MRMLLCALLLAASAIYATADTNVTGKWSGTAQLTGSDGSKETGAVLMLKQSGADITGSVGPDENEQHEITKGKIEGNKITLECVDGDRTIRFELVLADDRITGDVSLPGDGPFTKAKLDVTRSK